MSKSLEGVLGFTPLTTSLKLQTDGLPDLFPPEFSQTDPGNRIIGDRAQYIRVNGQRKSAKFNVYGSPAIRHELMPVGNAAVRCLHSYESFPIDLVTLSKLQSFEAFNQDEGADYVRYQFEAAAFRHKNAEVVALASTLRNFAIYFDTDYNLLPTSSGADTTKTVDFGVAATHKDQCNGCITNPWSLASTDIPGDIRNLQQFSRKETGFELTAALYGKNIPRYMTQNDAVQPYLSRSGDARDKFLMTGEIPSGLFGIKDWIPVYQSFYENSAGTNVDLWDDDGITFLPNVAQPDKMRWYRRYEGSYPVPKSLDIQMSEMAALNNYQTVYGVFAYAQPMNNPPQFEVYHGNTWLPAIVNEKAPFNADVTF